ncbi:hypothetical protein PsAD2_04278 [Pseudovibrio axinellae]|uniref:DUF2478 domain-containing protein n=1 Tax=Pseudovibrio axinellae TaxID=989403 RepID=A0A165T2Z7_9HYPH|nr:DUF2478 domain-containing protein [Pseudovibrio axinellae]KZL05353.1 hypothetical protein PsAD2_04278 [Pseudovibrio axinellae]SER84765.1 Nucleoside-triphosphatase THEP1 [Pseudovibrio axinellae]
MRIAYTLPKGKLVLTELSEMLREEGIRTCGIVQADSVNEDRHRCDMEVRVLPDGPEISITQSLGKEALGCRLDTSALAQAAAEVTQRINDPFDLFILNKFGEQEASGSGFRDLIAKALENGASVLVGTNDINIEAFKEFSGGMAEFVEPNVTDLKAWLDNG